MRLPAQLLHRKLDTHKGDYGRVLILAGSKRYVGAACLSAKSALRSGAGQVILGVAEGIYSIVASKVAPEVIILPLAQTGELALSSRALKGISEIIKSADCVLIGPGLARNSDTEKLVYSIIESVNVPLVIDADALNAVADNLRILDKAKSDIIMTPHPGEMSRLCRLAIEQVQKDRKKVAKNFALRYNITLILKGFNTIVASNTGNLFVNKTGNPGMATAGSGDVLAGIVSAFLGQALKPFDAACFAVHVHGLAGDLAAKDMTQTSLIASDLIDYLPKAFNKSAYLLPK